MLVLPKQSWSTFMRKLSKFFLNAYSSDLPVLIFLYAFNPKENKVSRIRGVLEGGGGRELRVPSRKAPPTSGISEKIRYQAEPNILNFRIYS